jgi:hypothetical protein
MDEKACFLCGGPADHWVIEPKVAGGLFLCQFHFKVIERGLSLLDKEVVDLRETPLSLPPSIPPSVVPASVAPSEG